MSTTTRTPGVWDLTDDTAYPVREPMRPEVPGPDRGGAIAASAGLAALASALIPGLPPVARWCLVIGLGVVAVLIGFAALRRRQILLTVLLAVTGMVAPLLAAGAIVLTPAPAPTLENRVLPTGSPLPTSPILRTTAELDARPLGDRRDAQTAARQLALHLRAMHGASGPFPSTLAASADSVVELGGVIEEVRVGRIPEGTHVRYSVAPDQRFFEVRVAFDDDDAAAATADSTIELTPAG